MIQNILDKINKKPTTDRESYFHRLNVIPPFNRLYMGTFSHESSVLLRLFVYTIVPKVVPILFGNYKAFGPPTSRCNLKKSLLSIPCSLCSASLLSDYVCRESVT